MSKQKNASTWEVEVYLPHLFATLLRKMWLMVLGGMLGAVILFSCTYFFEPVEYRSSAMFYVNNSTIHAGDYTYSGVTSADISASKNLVYTYITILNTRDSMKDIVEYAGVDRSYEEVWEMISAASVEETEIFRVNVVGSDPVEVQEITAAIAHVLPKRIALSVEGSSAQLVEASVIATSRSGPNYEKSGKVGFLAGFLVTMTIIATACAVDTTIRREEDITRFFPFALLASIPDMAGQKNQPLVGSAISFPAAEGYKLLRTKLEFSFQDEGSSRVIGITSAAAGEGKTTTAANLACNFAALGKRVLMIDCDMRRSSLHERLPVKSNPGLSEFLSGQGAQGEVLQTCTLEDKISFQTITAGSMPPNPVELLGSSPMRALLARMRKEYELILLDLPPIGEVGDALTAAELADGMLVVVQQDKTKRKMLEPALRQLQSVESRILGFVLNKQREHGSFYRKTYYRRTAASRQRRRIHN